MAPKTEVKSTKASKEETVQATKTTKGKEAVKEKVVAKGKEAVKKTATKGAKTATKGAKTATKGAKTATKTKAGSENTEKVERHYRMIIDMESGETSGYYSGNNPKQAAIKAYSSYLKTLKKQGDKIPKKLEFAIKETTRSGNNKRGNVTFYSGKRETLKEPVEVQVKSQDGELKTILYKFRNLVKRDRELDTKFPELAGGAKKKRAEAKKKLMKKEKKAKDAAEGKKTKKTTKKATKKDGTEKKASPKKAVAKKTEPAKKAATKKAEPAKKAATKKAEPAKKAATKKAEPAKKAPAKKAATKAK